MAEKDNAYIIINGDLLNNATKTSVSDSYAEDIPPMQQIQTAVEMFELLKDKILAITSGNHERRTYQKEGIDLMEIVARQIGLYDRFSKSAALIFLRFGRNDRQRRCLYPYMPPRSGGGRKEGQSHSVPDMASIVDTDIYIHSHTLTFIMKQAFLSGRLSEFFCCFCGQVICQYGSNAELWWIRRSLRM